jgi:hypothetical protein
MIDGHFEGLLAEKQAHRGAGKEFTGGRSPVTIDILPDVALLEIFDYYVGDERQIEVWHTLVHVCRKWRAIVFGSPRRLNLRLRCVPRTPVRETLDIWPPLPIVLVVLNTKISVIDNILAALEHNDRICDLFFHNNPRWQLEEVLAAMQRPFQALTRLHLHFQPGRETREEAPVIPASFLGASTPRLQRLSLHSIPFPALPNLLLSATHLVDLGLWRIPHSGYFSPEALVTGLSVLTSLRSLVIDFKSLRSRPDRRSQRPPLQTRTLLPVLTKLQFHGVVEYLEDLLARIDAPLLDRLHITFYNQNIFDTTQFTQFISRTPKFKGHDEARVVFSYWGGSVTLSRTQTSDGRLHLTILCSPSDRQLSSLAQVCSSSFPQAPFLAVEHLYILDNRYLRPYWPDEFESGQWLGLLHPFTAVKGLHISRELAPRIAPALQVLVGERATEVLPALQTLFLETLQSGPVQETIGQFVTTRQLADRPIAVCLWERKGTRFED